MAGLRTVKAPTAEPVGLEEAIQYARVIDDGDTRVVERLLGAARAKVEQDTRRALVERPMEETFDQWPRSCRVERGRVLEPEIVLSGTPLKSVQSVKYLDTDGVEQTLDPATYKVVVNQEPGRIRRRRGQTWPDTSDEADAITVRFTAGYGEDDDVPDEAKLLVLMLVAHWYENREAADVATGGTVSTIPEGYRSIVNNLTVPRVV